MKLTVNGKTMSVASGTTVAAAAFLAGESIFRRSVRGEARGPLCGMGICFECRVTIDGEPQLPELPDAVPRGDGSAHGCELIAATMY